VWVPGHEGILGNERDDGLAKKGADTPFTGPEPILGLPYSVVKRTIGDWMERKHIECWKSSKDCRHSKAHMEGPQQSRATKLLNMSRQQLSIVIGLLTGHLCLYDHLHKIGEDINPLCRRCLNGNETVEHLLCKCESLTMSRGRIFGQIFGELQQLSHVPVELFLRFAIEIGLARK
jgi:Ribonuclease HI